MSEAGNKHSDTASTSQGRRPTMRIKQEDDPLLSTEIQLLKKEVANLRQLNMKLLTEVRNLAELVSDKVLPSVDDGSNRQDLLERSLEQTKAVIIYIQQQINDKNQDDLKNEIEIAGVAEKPDEDLCLIVTALSQKVGVELSESDINFVVRVGFKIPETESHLNPPHRPIVVSLVRKIQRDKLLRAAKATIVTSENVVEGPVEMIFFRQRLTLENRLLLRISKERAIQYGFRFCWICNGFVYVRKADGTRAIRITCLPDLDAKVGPPQLFDEETVSS